MWLGEGLDTTKEIYGVKPLDPASTERYLGVQVGLNVDPNIMWDNILSKLPAMPDYWSSLGFTIFGRTLLLNACLLATISR